MGKGASEKGWENSVGPEGRNCICVCVCVIHCVEKMFYGGFALTYVNLGHDEFCFLI